MGLSAALKISGALLLAGCAAPVVMTHGVPNLHEVSDNIYRSGQIESAEGWQYMYDLGVRVDVKMNARSEGTDDQALALGIEVHELGIEPIGDQDIFDDIVGTFREPNAILFDEGARLLAAATPARKTLVHCTHGWDRTNAEVGAWRVRTLHWGPDRAWAEMLDDNYHPELIGLTRFWWRRVGGR
jgi:hypothetical protein